MTPVGVVTGALFTAGAALLPVADHHSATIASSLPPLSNIVGTGIGAISGGHRHGTHSLLGVIAFVAVAFVAGLWTAGAFVTSFAPEEPFWFPIAVGLGVVVHILGDLLTTGGCNRVWRPRALAKMPEVPVSLYAMGGVGWAMTKIDDGMLSSAGAVSGLG